MENKYYTPAIDEFCVGFEYEYNRFNVDLYKQDTENLEFLPTNTWVKKTVGSNFILCYSAEYLKQNLLRVKYLDKTDIESLGFIQRDTVAIQHLFGPINLKSDEEQIIYTKPIPEFGGLTAYLHFYTNRSTYGTVLSIHKDLTNPYNQKQLFYGTIKNKSELVKLLKMLGINE